jgi:hypothetical protein
MQTDNPKVVTAKDILKWADEVLNVISAHTNSDVVMGQVLAAANAARRGDLGNSSYPTYPESRSGRQG